MTLLSITHVDNANAENCPDEVLVDNDLFVVDRYVIHLSNVDLLTSLELEVDDVDNVDEKSASRMHVDHRGANH